MGGCTSVLRLISLLDVSSRVDELVASSVVSVVVCIYEELHYGIFDVDGSIC